MKLSIDQYVGLHTIPGTNTKQPILDELQRFRVIAKKENWPLVREFSEWLKEFDVWLNMSDKEKKEIETK